MPSSENSWPPVTPMPPEMPAPVVPVATFPLWNGWDVVQIALMMFLSPFLLFFLVGGVAKHYFYRNESWTQLAQEPIVALAAEFLAYIIVFFLMVMLIEGKYHTQFGEAIEWRWPRSSFGLIALGVLLLFSLQGIAHFLPIPKEVPFDQFFKHPLDAWLTSIFAVSFGPLMEELFFRGFLYPVIARRTGITFAVLITALLFGLLHATQLGFAWGPILIIFLVGVVLTVVRAASRSVASSFLVHVAYNGTLTVFTLIATGGFRHLERLNQ
jgi:membrane protease YdiL (CAAX protease family)